MEGFCFFFASLLLLLISLDQANILQRPAFFSEEGVSGRKVENFSERIATRQSRIQEVCKRHKASLRWEEKRRERCMKRHIWDVVNHLVQSCKMSGLKYGKVGIKIVGDHTLW